MRKKTVVTVTLSFCLLFLILGSLRGGSLDGVGLPGVRSLQASPLEEGVAGRDPQKGAAVEVKGLRGAGLSEEGLTRDCVSWEPLPTVRSEKGLLGGNPRIAGVTESNEGRKNSFEKIWDSSAWGKESKSGPGSLLNHTEKMREVLDLVIGKVKKELNKDSLTFLDSSCGDMTWMPTFLENRSDVVFTGYDIVAGNVEGHSKRFQDRPWTFEVHDIVAEPLAQHDLILSRHTLQHLVSQDIQRALSNFISSGSSFLLTTNFPGTKRNGDLDSGKQYRFRPVNLLLAPFFLPPPICSAVDIEDIHIALWDLRRVREGMARAAVR